MAIDRFKFCGLGLSLLLLAAAWTSAAADSTTITYRELQDLTKELFAKDVNNKMHTLGVNLQGRTSSSQNIDKAPKPLLSVPDSVRMSSTIALLRDMSSLYEPRTDVAELLTFARLKKEVDFLEALLNTDVLRRAMTFLAEKGRVPEDRDCQRTFLHQLWFKVYERGNNVLSSCAFEHVFLGEINARDGLVVGFHNWVTFDREEAAGRANYMGYIRNALDLKKAQLLTLQFSWRGFLKPMTTMLVGTSPELELALYTLCFFAQPSANICELELHDKKFEILVHPRIFRGEGITITTAYPRF